jgi:8-amino-3,8-dideoxy-alpha-D-manno-octulosonate transaminase
LHAAVGLAQIRKLPTFLEIQRRNHAYIKNVLSQIPEITFRQVPDEDGDSCTFLSWFLPTAEIAYAVVNELKAQGILAGNFYWFDNNWHYVRKWQHLKRGARLGALNNPQKTSLEKLAAQSFIESDKIMSRCISTLINLSWSEEQLQDKANKLASAVKAVLETKLVEA